MEVETRGGCAAAAERRVGSLAEPRTPQTLTQGRRKGAAAGLLRPRRPPPTTPAKGISLPREFGTGTSDFWLLTFLSNLFTPGGYLKNGVKPGPFTSMLLFVATSLIAR